MPIFLSLSLGTIISSQVKQHRTTSYTRNQNIPNSITLYLNTKFFISTLSFNANQSTQIVLQKKIFASQSSHALRDFLRGVLDHCKIVQPSQKENYISQLTHQKLLTRNLHTKNSWKPYQQLNKSFSFWRNLKITLKTYSKHRYNTTNMDTLKHEVTIVQHSTCCNCKQHSETSSNFWSNDLFVIKILPDTQKSTNNKNKIWKTN